MSAENRLREAAIAAGDQAAEILGGEGYDSGLQDMLAWATLAERLHVLADRRDAADFTEPSTSVPELQLGGLQLKHLEHVLRRSLAHNAHDQRTQDLLDLVREVRR